MKVIHCDITADPVIGPTGGEGHGPTCVAIEVELQGYEMAAIEEEVARLHKTSSCSQFQIRRALIKDVATGRKIVKLELVDAPKPNPLGTAE